MKPLEWLHSRAGHRANYGLLLGSMLLVVLGYPILEELGVQKSWVLSSLFVIVLFGCLAAAIERTRYLALLFGVVILVEVIAGAFDLGGPGAYSVLQHTTRATVLSLTAGVLLRDVMRAPTVNTDTILGAVCVYLLLGMTGAEVYALLLLLDPGAFEIAAHLVGSEMSAREAMSITTYYSFVTMTTLGYGDITPVSATARAVTSVQAVTGQLYIAVIVARLVALQVSNATQDREHEAARQAGSDGGAPPQA